MFVFFAGRRSLSPCQIITFNYRSLTVLKSQTMTMITPMLSCMPRRRLYVTPCCQRQSIKILKVKASNKRKKFLLLLKLAHRNWQLT